MMKISNENVKVLEEIQEIIIVEDGKKPSLDQVLSYILNYYRTILLHP